MTEPLEEVGTPAQIRRGLAWSAANNTVVRLGGLAVGIVLARLLSPDAFGTYAVAMTVQLVLVTLAELGVGADLVRRGGIELRGPTVATIALVASLLLTLTMVGLARPLARLMGAEEATPVVQVMSLTLLCAGLGVVPYAVIQRNLLQSTQLLVDGTGLLVSTAVTLGCIAVGAGPMSLALGRVASQVLCTGLQFALTRTRPRFGWDRQVAREALRFGIPIAGANLLSWVILNVDNVVVGHTLGPVALGLYVIAFNLSSWPMTAVGQTIRSVALPAFSRLGGGAAAASRALGTSAAYAWSLALPLGALLLIFADPLVTLLYGRAWAASAPVLTALAVFGSFRVIFDLLASFLYARGVSRSVLGVQVAWLVVLVPAMLLGIAWGGLPGAGWVHLGLAALLLLPIYLLALQRAGVRSSVLLLAAVRPVLACLPASALAVLVMRAVDRPLATLALGGATFVLSYLVPLLPWLRRTRSGAVAAGGERGQRAAVPT
jgi:PST family polysaccharide transporter